MIKLSEIINRELPENSFFYGVIPDTVSLLPSKNLQEISIKVNPETNNVFDDDAIDTLIAFYQNNVRVIYEIPFDANELDIEKILTVFSQFHISISILQSTNFDNIEGFKAILQSFINSYFSEVPRNFKGSIYPISQVYTYLLLKSLSGDKNVDYTDRYLENYYKNLFDKDIYDEIVSFIQKNILKRFHELVKDDADMPYKTQEEAFLVFAKAMQSVITPLIQEK